MQGTVKSFDPVYGSGWIIPDGIAGQVYVNHAWIAETELAGLLPGRRVSFEVVCYAGMKVGKQVRILDQNRKTFRCIQGRHLAHLS